MTQYGFFSDQSRCYGCKACSVACKDWYDIAPGPEKWMSVHVGEGALPQSPIGIPPSTAATATTLSALGPARTSAQSFKEDSTAVLVDQDKCKGDRHCFEACPYEAPKFASDEPARR